MTRGSPTEEIILPPFSETCSRSGVDAFSLDINVFDAVIPHLPRERMGGCMHDTYEDRSRPSDVGAKVGMLVGPGVVVGSTDGSKLIVGGGETVGNAVGKFPSTRSFTVAATDHSDLGVDDE